TGWQLSPPAEGRPGQLIFHVARHGDEAFDVADVRDALADAPAGRWRVRIIAAPRAGVAALVEVPALGVTSVRPVPAGSARAGRTSHPGPHGPGQPVSVR